MTVWFYFEAGHSSSVNKTAAGFIYLLKPNDIYIYICRTAAL